MILVDSNIWIYFLDVAAKEHARVKKRLPPALDDTLLVPTLVQMEVVHHLVKRLGQAAEQPIETFLSQAAEIEPLTGGITFEASRLLLTHRDAGIGGRDACLLVMADRRVAKLLTHDGPLATVAQRLGIVTSDPAA